MRLRPAFRKHVYRLTIAGVLILIAFPLGVFAYLRTLSSPDYVELRYLGASIQEAASHDTEIIIGNRKFIIKKGEIEGWTETYTRAYNKQEDLRFTDALDLYVADLAKKTDRPPVNARFVITEGKPVVLVAAQEGYGLNIASAALELRQGFLANKQTIILHPQIIEPDITEEKISSLGIKDRLGLGESNFIGSSKARIQNINVASKRYNGHIIKPGETFSFNDILGEVEAYTGYAPEKVIKDGKIQYEYGGGVCQVSTTLFRAAAAAGLPIVERKPHAFPVAYYAPHGFDATIYPGISDLRFINDTNHPVLIQTSIKGTKITFELYGTNDGRSVVLDGPHTYDVQPDGSMKAYIARKISYLDGTEKKDTFYSNYKSPALYPTQPNPYE